MLYTEGDLENPKAQKILKRMQKMKVVDKKAKVELICGGMTLGSMGHCVICTDKGLSFYEVDGILPKISNYSYTIITGASVSTSIHTSISLSIGGAQTAILKPYCSIEDGIKITEFILSKIAQS